jgi:hypothetical protein
MVRNLIGVIAGYLAAGLSVFAVFALAQSFLDTDPAAPSALRIGIAVVVGILAAILGGRICLLISRSSKAVLSLALVMVALGALTAAYELSHPVGPTESRQPVLLLFLNPVLGFAGVLLGGRSRLAQNE